MYLQLAENNTEPYISVPTNQGLVKVREDYFDSLPPAQWEATMDRLAPFQPSMGLSELSDKETRRRRREARTLKKEAKAADVASGARGERRSAALGKVTDALGKVAGAAGQLLPGIIPGAGGAPTGTPDANVPADTEQKGGMPKWVIPVGIGVAGLGLVYFLTRKK
jgi:hypothetical protein